MANIFDLFLGKNHAGATAFKDDLYTATVKLLTTGTLEDTYYVKAKKLAQESIKTLSEMRDKEPEFLAKAIVYSRNLGHMRTLPITALVILSAGNDKAKALTRQIFNSVIVTPGDLQDFVLTCKSGVIRKGLGRMIKTLVNNWLANISEYHVIKYASENQKMSLKRIYKLTRPKLKGKAAHIARYILTKELPDNSFTESTAPISLITDKKEAGSQNTNIIPISHTNNVIELDSINQISGYELFKKSKRADLIKKYNLPFEVVTAHNSSKDAWEAIFKAEKLPFMFMLRNLNNAYTHGLFNDPEILDRVVNRLTDPQSVLNSKQFPYRFYSAIKALNPSFGSIQPDTSIPFIARRSDISNIQKCKIDIIIEALVKAMDISVSNFPEINGQTLIASDFSGSMHQVVSSKSDITYSEIANIFAASLYKKCSDAEMVGFHQNLVHIKNINKHSSLISIFKTMNELSNGWATDMTLPVKYALETKKFYDTIIYLTDNVSWYDQVSNGGTPTHYVNAYRKNVNPHVKVIVVDIAPYQISSLSNKLKDVYQISGWSDAVLKFIPFIVSGNNKAIKEIKNINLKSQIKEELAEMAC